MPIECNCPECTNLEESSSHKMTLKERVNKQRIQNYKNSDRAWDYVQNRIKNCDFDTSLSIDDIIREIKNDDIIINYMEFSEGKCFDSAKRIGELLNQLNINPDDIKFRLCHITKPGNNWTDVNIMYNENHMVTVINHQNRVYVFDPTIHQFIGIDVPFFGSEDDWLEAIKPSWNGRVIKKAIQYIDYTSYQSADNASQGYRVDFFRMKEQGGVFINEPKWFIDFYDKEMKRDLKKSKKRRSILTRCIRPDTVD